MKSAAIAFLMVFGVGAAVAQTPAYTPPAPPIDDCTGPDTNLSDCGMQANTHKAYDIARYAWGRAAAENGDAIAAIWLGELYERGDGGVEQFLVQAYKWYDIAAALRAAEHDSNKTEINYRDATAKEMTPGQIAEAQKESREWLARTAKTRHFSN